jgi:hypothetical protein
MKNPGLICSVLSGGAREAFSYTCRIRRKLWLAGHIVFPQPGQKEYNFEISMHYQATITPTISRQDAISPDTSLETVLILMKNPG